MILRFGFGIIILLLLIINIGIEDLLSNIVKINLLYIPLFIFLALCPIIINAINTLVITRGFGYKVSIYHLIKYHLYCWVFGLISPGKIGEFSIVYFLKKKEKIPTGEGTASLIIDKAISLIILSVLASIGFFLYFTVGQGTNLLLINIALVVVGYLIFFTKAGRTLIKKRFLRSFSEKFKGFSKSLFRYSTNNKRSILLNVLLIISKYLVGALLIHMFFISFNIYNINYFDVLIIYCTSVIICMIPVSINGLGLKEAVSIVLYDKLGIDKIQVGSVFIALIIFRYVLGFMIWLILTRNKMAEDKVK